MSSGPGTSRSGPPTYPVTDPRRMAFYANSKDSFSKSFLSGLPVPNIYFTHTQWRTTVALRLGIPIPALRAHVGKHIQSGTHRGGLFIADAQRHNLLTAPTLLFKCGCSSIFIMIGVILLLHSCQVKTSYTSLNTLT
jgi:hypothetical protein